MIPSLENHFDKITAWSLIYFFNYSLLSYIFSPVANFVDQSLIYSNNTYTYVFANGNDNPIFKPKPKNHSVDNNMFQVHRKFFNLKFWKEWVKTKDSFWDLASFMQSMLHFPAWAVTKFWHLCQLRAASLSRSLLLLVATIYPPIKELRIHSIYLPTYYLIVFKVCPAHKIVFHG